jgi:hypothetical protein
VAGFTCFVRLAEDYRWLIMQASEAPGSRSAIGKTAITIGKASCAAKRRVAEALPPRYLESTLLIVLSKRPSTEPFEAGDSEETAWTKNSAQLSEKVAHNNKIRLDAASNLGAVLECGASAL